MDLKYKNYLISENSTIKNAINLLNKNKDKCLIVVDKKNTLKGTITDGDIRRALVQGKILNNNIKKVYKKNPEKIYLNKYLENDKSDAFFKKIKEHKVLPIVNKKKKIVNILNWTSFSNNKKYNSKNIKVVIMSGGEGRRLFPYTVVVPKPLVPVNEKAIIDHIIEKFENIGINNFYLTVNYKMNLLKAYFSQQKTIIDHIIEKFENIGINNFYLTVNYKMNLLKAYFSQQKKIKIKFINEKKPLGTAGSLSFFQKKIKESFFVTNCDSLIIYDYNSIYKYHNDKQLDLTIVAAKKIHYIPYGVCILSDKGLLNSINEKPKYDFLINTGFYIVNPRILKFIKKNKHLNMDDFINILLKKKMRVGVYSINENSWLDFGQWNVFNNSSNALLDN